MEQINSRGQALEDGLDVFISVPFLSGEYSSYGSSFIPSTLSSTNISTSTVAYATEAVASANLPTYTSSGWFRFTSDGTSQPSATSTPPTSSVNNINLSAVVDGGGNSSVSGIFQELKQLYTGSQYSASIKLHQNTNIGTLKVSIVYKSPIFPYPLIQSDITSYNLPSNELTFNFKAYSTADIICITFESSVDSSLVDIFSVSVQERKEYKMPVVTDITLVGISKVLRRRFNSSITLDDGEPVTTD